MALSSASDIYETENLLTTDEAALHDAKRKCEKNPGHSNFIPIEQLTVQRLPVAYRSWEILKLLQYVGDLTAKLTVKYISVQRPPNYYLHDYRGSKCWIRYGSGAASISASCEMKTRPCPFADCTEMPHPHDVYGYFHVFTAQHAVFDTSEAERTFLDFCYDDENDKTSIIKARGVKVYESSEKLYDDRCIIECVTHDPKLVDIIIIAQAIKSGLLVLTEKIPKETGTDLVFIVSHPHGCSKQVAFGGFVEPYDYHIEELSRSLDERYVVSKFRYDAATCRGSSGAPVMTFTRDGIYASAPHATHVHGSINRSGEGGFWMTPETFDSNPACLLTKRERKEHLSYMERIDQIDNYLARRNILSDMSTIEQELKNKPCYQQHLQQLQTIERKVQGWIDGGKKLYEYIGKSQF